MRTYELESIIHNFRSELERAEHGERSSLSFIASDLSARLKVQTGEVFQVIVIGGTVFRSALCECTETGIKIKQKTELPFTQLQNLDDFLAVFRDAVLPDIRVLALNFAYPLEPVIDNGVMDGILLRGSKEHQLSGVVGKKVGELITLMLKNERSQDVFVTVANDTVCLLLSGLSQFKHHELFGGIAGTGINFAFFQDSTHIITLESGNFDKFPTSLEARTIDRKSASPGEALFEKDTTGAYLYKHFNFKMQSLDPSFRKLESTLELEQLSREQTMAGDIARNLLDHSAQLVACQIAGILEYKQRNMVGVMEGSLFWKAEHYTILVDTYVHMLSPFSVKFVKIDEDSIIGGAMLVRKNSL